MKKGYAKRLIAFCLALLALMPNAFATKGIADDSCVHGESTINNIINEDGFYNTFTSMNNAQEDNTPIPLEQQMKVDYTYTLSPQYNGELLVNLDFVASANGMKVPISVEGLCREEYVSDELTVLFGCLSGNTDIFGDSYDVTVGFVKNVNSDQINAGVSLFKQGMTDISDAVRFSFGDTVITPEMVKNVPSKTYMDGDFTNSTYDASSSSGYTYKTQVSADFDSVSAGGIDIPDGFASYLRLYYNQSIARVVLGLRTYTHNADRSFEFVEDNGAYHSTTLDSCTIGLEKTNRGGVNILGLERYPEGVTVPSSNALSTIIANLLGDIFKLSGSAVNALEATLSAIGSGFTATVYGDTDSDKSVLFKVGLFDQLDFDDTYLPVEFNLVSTGAQTSSFSGYSSVTYRTSVTWPSTVEYYYTYAEDVSTKSVNLSTNG